MHKSLYAKLAIVLLVLFFLIGISIIVISIISTEKYQQEVNQKLNRKLANLIVAEKGILQDNKIDKVALKELFHMLMVINPSIEVYLLDTDGKILAFSAEAGKVKRSKINLDPVKEWIKGDVTLPFLGDDPRDPYGSKIFSAAPIAPEGKLEGYLYVILGGETYDSIIQKIKGSYILQLSIRVVAISLLVALLAGLLVFAFLTRKLKRLAAAMDSYESGKPANIPPEIIKKKEQTSDEIDRLVATFSNMTERINQQMNKLAHTDILRRGLVANISHDLRTPLATLRGYIETLLMKDDSLPADERKKYLKIAINHCERLSNLITDLFELAKLEASDHAVQAEPFNLGELVQDVVQKFELSAGDKNINITTNIGKELPFTFADIALIERALENLINNALRFTPEEGTVSIVLTDSKDDHITLEIKDTGPGIPEKELTHIFDRFYQLDKSRKSKSGHSGLGLAITSKILKLHGSSIKVQSVINSGTNFSFKLPVHRTA